MHGATVRIFTGKRSQSQRSGVQRIQISSTCMKRNQPATEKFWSLAVLLSAGIPFLILPPLWALLFRGGHVTCAPFTPQLRQCWETRHLSFKISATSGCLFVWTPGGSTTDARAFLYTYILSKFFNFSAYVTVSWFHANAVVPNTNTLLVPCW